MKKILVFLLSIILIISVVGCDNGRDEAREYRLGIGIVPYVTANTNETAQFGAVVATVVTDSGGKITDCEIDEIENTVSIKGGMIDYKTFGEDFKTKQQLGDDYGMKEASGIGKEWYEQTDDFCDYVVGMTRDQVLAISLSSDGKAEDSVISAGCTINITNFIKAVVEACDYKGAKTFKADDYELGISAISRKNGGNDASGGTRGVLKLESDICAVALTDDHKVLSAIIDTIEPEIEFSETGSVLTPAETVFFTKRDLGDNYGMKKVSGIGKEWYEQADAFEEYIVGLDSVGVKSMKTVINADNGKVLTDEAELRAGCTIAVDGYMKVCHSAIESAK